MSTRIVILVGLCFAAAGCGGAVDPLAGSPNRLQVTNTLRAACRNFGWSDGDILGYLALIESDRLAGTTYANERATASIVCINADDACIHCLFAEIDQVYGR